MPEETEDLTPQQPTPVGDERPAEPVDDVPAEEPGEAQGEPADDEQPERAEQADDDHDEEAAAEQGEQQAEPEGPDYDVRVEDAGTLKKKITVTIPADAIAAKRDEMFGELAGTAQVPGFRIGRAPRRLVEKRFGREVARDVRNALLGESLGSVMQNSDLKTIGEPEMDLDAIELPESGDLSFDFEIEVAPEFELPELTGIPIDKPVVEVTDERVEQAVDRARQRMARYEPTTDQPAEAQDVVTAEAKVTGDRIEERTSTVTLHVAPGQVEGLPLIDLGEKLAGKKIGETAELSVKVPDVHPNEPWQGKQATVELTINEIRKRVLPELTDEFAKEAGFESMEELRDSVRTRMQFQVQSETRRAMRSQINQYLLDHTGFELPPAMAARHTERVLQRRRVDLMSTGMPEEEVDQRMTQIQASAVEQAQRDLKLSFILQEIAEARELTVGEEEINSRVASIAAEYGQRPERLRQQMEADGAITQLGMAILDEKVLDALLEDARITELTPEEAAARAAEAEQETEVEPADAAPDDAEADAQAEPAEEGGEEEAAAEADDGEDHNDAKSD